MTGEAALRVGAGRVQQRLVETVAPLLSPWTAKARSLPQHARAPFLGSDV